MNKRIYIDFDDVVCETNLSLIALNKQMFGREYSYESMHEFDLHISLGLSDEEYPVFVEKFHLECLPDIPPTPMACEVIRLWQEDGFRPTIVTGRPPYSYEASRQWLDRYGLQDVPLYHADKYNRFAGEALPHLLSLDELCKMDFALAVEDSPVSMDLLQKLDLCPFVIFNRPWNLSYPCSAPRFSDWTKLDSYVRALPDFRD